MKRTNIIREANVGSNVELSHVELVVLKDKWEEFMKQASNGGHTRTVIKLPVGPDGKTVVDYLNEFMSKVLVNVVGLEEAADALFSPEKKEAIIHEDIFHEEVSDQDVASHETNEHLEH